jgi:protein subunit release factor B
MLSFGVSAKKEEALREKMKQLGIREEDIVEKFIRSSGHGGQKVNKTSTCVYLKHLPTGVEVKCQKERYQSLNKDPTPEKEAFKKSQDEDAGGQKKAVSKKGRPPIPSFPR